jgi:hypothetical protein
LWAKIGVIVGQPGDIEETSEPTFQCPISVGKGVYLSGRRGTLTIDHGDLALHKRDGSVIAHAPTGEVWVAKGLDSVKVWVGDERFTLRPGSGAANVRVPSQLTASYGASLATKQFKQFKQFAAIILAVAEAEGAHIGKPGSTDAGGAHPS